MSDEQRSTYETQGRPLEPCPYRRKLRFNDSLLHIQTSVASLVDDLHLAVKSEGLSIPEAFPTSKEYCDSIGFTREQFELFVSTKMSMPYELCQTYEQMRLQTSPPSRESFTSILRGIDSISEEEHSAFVDTWNRLGISSLLQLMTLYAIGDVGKVLAPFLNSLIA